VVSHICRTERGRYGAPGGVAYLRSGDREKTTAQLKEFDYREGPAYEVDACKQMSDMLHQQFGK
jgi:hypothetical protein